MRHSRAFTLLELLIGMAVLGLLIITLFQAFDFGAKAFREATTRQDAQGATTRAYTVLRGDLRRSHFRSISTVERATTVEEEEVRRDALSVGSLRDWQDTASYDSLNGVPKWDRYVLFYATMDGKLVRTTVDLDSPDFSPTPFYDLDPHRYLQDDPSTNTGYQSGQRVLCENLLEFRCSLQPAHDTVQVQCTLLQKRDQRRMGRSGFELDIFPQNTWPKGDAK